MAIAIVILLLIFGGISLFVDTSSYTVENQASAITKKQLMVNVDFENELIKKIANPQHRQQILELIKDDLEYVYGEAWKDLYLNTPWHVSSVLKTALETKGDIVLFLLLSKSGLIPDCYKFSDIRIRNSSAANTYEALKILHCVEKNIHQKRGSAEYKLIFYPKLTREGYGKHLGPEVARYDLPFAGSFHWAFESFYYNSKFAIRDIHNTTLVINCKNCACGSRSDKEKNNPYKDKFVL